MIFNPITKQLLTRERELLKKLDCPFSINWDSLKTTDSAKIRLCDLCNKQIIDSSSISTEALIEKIKLNPDICLKVDLEQTNIRVEIDHA